MATLTESYTDDQVKEVSSWIHDERNCVSIGGISEELGLSRSQAQNLLRKVVSCGNKSYVETSCIIREEVEKPLGAFKSTGTVNRVRSVLLTSKHPAFL